MSGLKKLVKKAAKASVKPFKKLLGGGGSKKPEVEEAPLMPDEATIAVAQRRKQAGASRTGRSSTILSRHL